MKMLLAEVITIAALTFVGWMFFNTRSGNEPESFAQGLPSEGQHLRLR
jgi:hypothetical protein